MSKLRQALHCLVSPPSRAHSCATTSHLLYQEPVRPVRPINASECQALQGDGAGQCPGDPSPESKSAPHTKGDTLNHKEAARLLD